MGNGLNMKTPNGIELKPLRYNSKAAFFDPEYKNSSVYHDRIMTTFGKYFSLSFHKTSKWIITIRNSRGTYQFQRYSPHVAVLFSHDQRGEHVDTVNFNLRTFEVVRDMKYWNIE